MDNHPHYLQHLNCLLAIMHLRMDDTGRKIGATKGCDTGKSGVLVLGNPVDL